MSLLLGALIATIQSDPMQLKIGPAGSTACAVNQITSIPSGKMATPDDIAIAADGKKWVFLGENHATAPHQQLHADVIAALVKRGRKVMVGLEMLTRPKQTPLDQFWKGESLRSQFLKDGDWKGQWGYGYNFYSPIFEVCRTHRVPMVALNVPRDWVRTVGQKGFAGLTPEQTKELPSTMALDNANHRAVFASLMGGHPPTGPRGENIYAAQVLWDEGMADSAIKAREGKDCDVFVVLAGSGHVMYRQGINYRVAKRGQGDGITVVMTQSDTAVEASNGVGDFVYVTAPTKK
jgi:uncharacterized iron-regulated protein